MIKLFKYLKYRWNSKFIDLDILATIKEWGLSGSGVQTFEDKTAKVLVSRDALNDYNEVWADGILVYRSVGGEVRRRNLGPWASEHKTGPLWRYFMVK